MKLREAATSVIVPEQIVEQQNSQTTSPTQSDDDELDPRMLAQLAEGIQMWEQRIAQLESTLQTLEERDDVDAQHQKAELQEELDVMRHKVDNVKQNVHSLMGDAHKAESQQGGLAPSTPSKTNSHSQQSSPGILGVMRQLATESTLSKVLSAIGEIAKKNVGSGKANSAQDLLEHFRRMLESDEWEGRERVAYVDLATGAMSNSITGDNKSISADRLNILRSAYKNVMDLNTR